MVERQYPKDDIRHLPYTDELVGTEDNYIVTRMFLEEELARFKELTGQSVVVTITQDKWFYQYGDNEEHTRSITKLVGTLTQVTNRGITVQVESGETKYDFGGKVMHDAGKIVKAPFYNHVFRLRDYASVEETVIVPVTKQNINTSQVA